MPAPASQVNGGRDAHKIVYSISLTHTKSHEALLAAIRRKVNHFTVVVVVVRFE